MGALYIALMHGGVVDKTGSEIASSLTHFDVHDIARSCRTYGGRAVFCGDAIGDHALYRAANDLLLERGNW